MFMIYDEFGDPVSYQEAEPTSGTWTVIPASAMQDPPLSWWDAATQTWKDGDGGYRWDQQTQQFVFEFGRKQLDYQAKIIADSSACIQDWYPDYANALYRAHLGFEAWRYACDPAPSLVNYPMIDQLKTARGITEAETVADAKFQFLGMHGQMGAIWAKRVQALIAIDLATTIAELDAIINFDWIEDVIVPAPDLTDWPAPWLATGGADPWTHIKLAADSTVNTIAFANVSGMSFAGEANQMYRIEVFGAYQTAATTTGIGLALDVPAGASVVGQVVVNVNATGVGGTEQIADAATPAKSTGVRAANTNTPISAVWHVQMGATPGNIQLMQASEVASSNTVLKAGLTVMSRRAI